MSILSKGFAPTSKGDIMACHSLKNLDSERKSCLGETEAKAAIVACFTLSQLMA